MLIYIYIYTDEHRVDIRSSLHGGETDISGKIKGKRGLVSGMCFAWLEVKILCGLKQASCMVSVLGRGGLVLK